MVDGDGRVRTTIAPTDDRPPDFGAFWSGTRAALDEIPAALRQVMSPGPLPGTRLHRLSFASWGHERINGYAITWGDGAARPLIVHAHGYRSQAEPRLDWVGAGCHVVGFDIRGFGRSVGALASPSPDGWLLSGVRRPETSVLRGAVCDYIRAMQVAQGLDVVAQRTVCHGVSLAGGLATMAEAVAPRADLLVLGVPTFGWPEGRRLLVERGSGAEVDAFLRDNPQYPEDDLHAVFAYFDAARFARSIACPTLVGIGRVDRVVPAACVRAISDELRTPHEVMVFPVSHDAGPEMAAWEAFDRRWLELATTGVPDGFGRHASAAAWRTQPW